MGLYWSGRKSTWAVERRGLAIVSLFEAHTGASPPPRTTCTRPAQTGYLPHACNTPYPPSGPKVYLTESTGVCLYAQMSLHGLSLGFTSPDLTALSPPHPPGRGVGGVECVRKAQAPVRPPPRTYGGARGRHATHTKVDCARAKLNRFKPFFQCALARWP